VKAYFDPAGKARTDVATAGVAYRLAQYNLKKPGRRIFVSSFERKEKSCS